MTTMAIAGALAIGALVIMTLRLDYLLILAAPASLVLLRSFRAAVTVAIWAMMIWASRLPVVLFDFVYFSYAVYACTAISIGAYLLRRLGPGSRRVRLFTRASWALWLLIAVLIFGGLHGAMNAEDIPRWLLTDETIDLSLPWPYFRTFVLPGILQLLLALMIAAAYSTGRRPSAIVLPGALLIWTLGVMIIGYVVVSGESLRDLAQADQREFLSGLGFHANTFGALLAIAYALMLGLWKTTTKPHMRILLGATICITLVALLLSYSRGAYVACVAATGLYFMRGSPARKIVFMLLLLLLSFVVPSPFAERIQYSFETGDLNEMSAGRLELIWLPLLADIANQLVFGQGLNSIMWTEAQRQSLIAPVFIAHNGYLDLLLDVGIVGGALVIFAYVQVWREFLRMSWQDPDPMLRGLFHGGHLAMVSFALIALTNERITPTTTTLLLWITAGVLVGRVNWLGDCHGRSKFSLTGRHMRWDSAVRADNEVRARAKCRGAI